MPRLILRRCLTGTYNKHLERRPKTCLMKDYSLIVWVPGPFTTADAKITLFLMDALTNPSQVEGTPFCCLCFLRLSLTG